MLGYYRYILALLVAATHLWTGVMWWKGIYAVFGFYVISGYLMTLILNQTYLGFDGAWRYILNRILRIYPIYWVCMILSVIVITIHLNGVADPGATGDARATIGIRSPSGWSDWIKNLTLFGPEGSRYSLTQAWSLRVEMIFYVLMLVLCRRLWIVILWIIASIGICIYQQYSEVPFLFRYNSAMGASLAFALGALVYFINQKFKPNKVFGIAFIVVFISHFIFANQIWSFSDEKSIGLFREANTYGLYAHCLLASLALWAVIAFDETRIKTRFAAMGQYLGNIAYAVFLCHWIVGYLVMFMGVAYKDKPLFNILTFIGVNLLAVLIYHVIEKPINHKVRDKIRGQKPNRLTA